MAVVAFSMWLSHQVSSSWAALLSINNLIHFSTSTNNFNKTLANPVYITPMSRELANHKLEDSRTTKSQSKTVQNKISNILATPSSNFTQHPLTCHPMKTTSSVNFLFKKIKKRCLQGWRRQVKKIFWINIKARLLATKESLIRAWSIVASMPQI